MKVVQFVSALAIASLVAGVGVANAQSKEQLKCQAGTSKAGKKFVGATVKCILKCEADARIGKNPFSDCHPPYGGATAACIADPVKSAQQKARASIVKACTKTPAYCPSCYSGGDCTAHASAVVANLEVTIDTFQPAVACEEITNRRTARCIDVTAIGLAKFYGAKTKCYDKCYAGEAKGKTDGACNPFALGDTQTIACITKAEDKAIASLNKVCYDPPNTSSPACYDDGVHPPAILASPSTAAGWVDLFETVVDSVVPTTYCGA